MLTTLLGELISKVVQSGTSYEAKEAAKVGIIDTVATMLAGRRETPVQVLRRAFSPLTSGHALEFCGFEMTSAETAALINGVAAHVLDFDDVALRGHPSAVITPAIFALGSEIGSSGDDLLNAYVTGYQVWGELVDREMDMHPIKGWHTTSVFGAVGAAAACAVLLKLDAIHAAHAIGIGATQSSGLMANFGSMSKSFQTARAAQAGIVAAKLAKEGFTAGLDILEHSQGFLKAFSPTGNVDTETLVELPEGQWLVESKAVSIKKYPTCFYTHRSVDAILDLVKQEGIKPKDVMKIEVIMSHEHATILRNHFPQSGLEAKFSIEFAMACALVYGKIGLTELTDDIVQSSDITKLMKKVHVVETINYSDEWVGAAAEDQVFITLESGLRMESQRVKYAKGHANNPLSRADLDEKFLVCSEVGAVPMESSELLKKLWQLENHKINNLW
ncbi:MmgE/PrpD family protein [Advenella sp. WQ 585]|uniref:MmgE/PrpD family protein n=1 Tax=Advenella mandrilli TaxID=2800330 RepID=A0ABS1EHL0_9BURK|nr:MmgE/PrpD family protein [Advenella mandrilli]MBK1782466.1 MmgE/PrpD family protein [Advenella mandrilli]